MQKRKLVQHPNTAPTTYTQLRQGAFYTGATLTAQSLMVLTEQTVHGSALAAQTGENRLALQEMFQRLVLRLIMRHFQLVHR